MKSMQKVLMGWMLCMFLAGIGYADQLVITNFTPISYNLVSLGWTSPSNRFIIAQSPNLTTGTFQYVGGVLSTNNALISNNFREAFFKIRQVAIVEFPDPNLLTAVTNAIPKKYEPTGWIYDVDVENIGEIGVPGNFLNINDATGVKSLVALTNLYNISMALPSLDVSGMQELHFLYLMQHWNLTNLNVAGCTELYSLVCITAYILPSLDVSSCTNLSQVYLAGCNQLTNLNVSGCQNLVSINCANCRLGDLDVSDRSSLKWLNCEWQMTDTQMQQYGLTNLNVSGCTNLQTLDCSRNWLSNLNLSGCSNLEWLACGNNQFTNVDVSKLQNLSYLDVSGCTNLQTLKCGEGQLTNLNLSGLTSITGISCYDNLLTSLDLSSLNNLQVLNCYHNQLINLTLSGLTNLQAVLCLNNQLTSLDLSGLTNLQHLACEVNLLASLDLAGLTNHMFLSCSGNQLTNITSLPASLQYLDCRTNRLSYLNISLCTNLTQLDCSENQISDLTSFVSNAAAGGLGTGDIVVLRGNPLSEFAKTNQIPFLQSMGAAVYFTP